MVRSAERLNPQTRSAPQFPSAIVKSGFGTDCSGEGGITVSFEGKVVWVTGASSGIGEQLVEGLARRGARVVLSARRGELLRAGAGPLPP